jgi:hypothetical protein
MMRWSDRLMERWEQFRDWLWPDMYLPCFLVLLLTFAAIIVAFGGWDT